MSSKLRSHGHCRHPCRESKLRGQQSSNTSLPSWTRSELFLPSQVRPSSRWSALVISHPQHHSRSTRLCCQHTCAAQRDWTESNSFTCNQYQHSKLQRGHHWSEYRWCQSVSDHHKCWEHGSSDRQHTVLDNWRERPLDFGQRYTISKTGVRFHFLQLAYQHLSQQWCYHPGQFQSYD